ncbi:hypothetical protein [Candidatus Spongiihabitans sp.]|uniref:hypothetical protein n=1 Tax=Candidatus Spongiihabitans sp. TaxID=3101308 RepID=UPI003C6F7391
MTNLYTTFPFATRRNLRADRKEVFAVFSVQDIFSKTDFCRNRRYQCVNNIISRHILPFEFLATASIHLLCFRKVFVNFANIATDKMIVFTAHTQPDAEPSGLASVNAPKE